jgi:phenylalanyl-tRNA synthetase beta chain
VKISINWLRDFVDCQLPASELETLLRRAGLEVAGIDQRGAAIDHVVAAEILESIQHPNADRLSVCKVNDGSSEPRQIVCGAKNYKVGDKVPLALPGAVLPGDFKIKTGKLRGVESEGMMCSAKELRLAEDSDGLLILPPETAPGTPIKDLFPAETILELEITPNRSDWLSHLGVAREIGVFTGLPVKVPEPAQAPTASAEGQVCIESDGCSLYTLRRISGVKVGPSPQWLRDRLAAVGLRSVNNVVDVTNFVLFELGQPLHAFDAAKISGSLQVRCASEGEAFRALDGRDYKLPAGSLVIADANGPTALAGVMGGEASGVTESTTDILLESAVFDPSRVRRASRALGLFSDSNYRFERGVDPEGVAIASARAVELILRVAGGSAGSALLVSGKCPERSKVSLRHSRVRDLLGMSLTNAEIESALARVGLEKLAAGEETRWSIPGYRRELCREADLIEEIARVVGIEKIPSLAQGPFAASSDADAAYDFAMNLRSRLAGMGFHEARTSTLVSAAEVSHFGEAVALKNPFGEDQSQLRNSLVPGLLTALRRNLDQGAKSIALFECGRVFHPGGEGQRLAIVLTGERHSPSWRGGMERSWDVFDLTGAVLQLAGLHEHNIVSASVPAVPFGACADVFLHGKKIGVVGQLTPAVGREIGASTPLLCAEFDLDLWRAEASTKSQVSALAKFPGSARDIAFLAPLALPYGEVRSLITDLREPLLESVRLFDLFIDVKGEKIPSDKKSMAISLTFRSPERTLTSDEIQAATDRIKAALKDRVGVDFRE